MQIKTRDNMLKIHADYSHYQNKNRKYLIEILRPVWNDSALDEKVKIYGEWVSRYSFTEKIEDADVCFLPMTWTYYVENGLEKLAEKAVAQAKIHNKPVILFNTHDFSPHLPFSNVILFEHSGYRSRKGDISCFGLPAFFPDYQRLYCAGNPIYRHKKNNPPVVGFCGAVVHSLADQARHLLTFSNHWMQFYTGISKWEPPSIPTYVFRKRVLAAFTNNQEVTPNFIFRNKFRAGMNASNDFDPLKLAFVQNILGSDYTICVRGEGNYSYRFYETLNLGRIPVFIDTDCLLPWENTINYRDYFPWIEYHEIPFAAEKLRDYHNSLTDDDFVDLQKQCRELWLYQFTYKNFFAAFVNYLGQTQFRKI